VCVWTYTALPHTLYIISSTIYMIIKKYEIQIKRLLGLAPRHLTVGVVTVMGDVYLFCKDTSLHLFLLTPACSGL